MTRIDRRRHSRQLIIDRIATTHYERYGWGEPGFRRTWADSRRLASWLCRRDIAPEVWEQLGHALDTLERALTGDPELIGTPGSPEYGPNAAEVIESLRDIYEDVLRMVAE